MNREDFDRWMPMKVVFAPMVGLSHYAVRASIADQLLPGQETVFFTEMLSSFKIPEQKENSNPEVCFRDTHRRIVAQLLANEEEPIQKSIDRLLSWGVSGIDINMGCPVQKALKHNYGVALMGDPVYAAQVVKWARKSTKVPVSVKLRSGFPGQTEDQLFDFFHRLYDAGADYFTLHPRFSDQGRKGRPDWALVSRIKEAFDRRGIDVPILVNGEIQNEKDFERCLKESHADRVMMGRALLTKPWLIRLGEKNFHSLDPYQSGEVLGKFLISCLSRMREVGWATHTIQRKMRFLIVYQKPYIEYGEYLQGRIQSAKDLDSMQQNIQKFFEVPQKVIEWTHLAQ